MARKRSAVAGRVGPRRWGAATLAVVLAAGLLGQPGASPAGADPVGAAAAANPTWVTLITGDRVAVLGSGQQAALRVEPAPRGRPVPFQDFVRHGDRYVLPADAAPLVRSGVLDRELFNVTGLIRQGYDDAHTSAMPLLVQDAAGKVRAAAVPAGSKVRRELPGLGMQAVDQPKDGAPAFFSGLTAGDLAAHGAATPRIWLNQKVRASLDESVPRIGAPTAWQAGLTGAGVQVAVLDTGIDTDHPDLAGKVAQSMDFSGTGSVEDGFGHGTHVASIITGSGAASGGRYKGAAPDVRLAVGKVLDDTGSGSFDMVLAGMQWAAADAHAKVVNMSLGAGPSDGTDPMSQAVNSLSRQYGTLFVISAGNFGGDETVATPAAADDALAVANVTKQDVLSPSSSRGPRLGDGALKPEIAAPGTSIVAARPAGVEPIGEPVGDAYQRLDGTSMAAPHVAGSAAILAQQHPEWTGQQLKAALVSTAHEIPGSAPLSVGAGRVDLARAISAPVIATAAASAHLPWPNTGQQVRRTVTWTNVGTAPVTLDLRADLARADGAAAPDGLLALSATSVTVPAGGSASVELTITAQADQAGTYAGILTARSAGGATTRTALSVRQQEEMHTLTASALNRDGVQPGPADRVSLWLTNMDTGDMAFGDPGSLVLPKGRYAVHAVIETPRANQEPTISVISDPELVLDHDRTQVFDARLGQPISAEPDNAAARGGSMAINVLTTVRACDCRFGLMVDVDPIFHSAFAATLPGTESDGYAFVQARRATEPTLELTANDGQPFPVYGQWLTEGVDIPRTDLAAVYGGAGTPEDLSRIDATGKLVLIDLPGQDKPEFPQRLANIKAAGGRIALVNFVSQGAAALAAGAAATEELPALWASGSPTVNRFATLVRAGATTVSFASRGAPNHRYELVQSVERKLTTPQHYRPRTSELAAVRTNYHDNVAGTVHYVSFLRRFDRMVGSGTSQPAAAQQERTEYFTPGTWDMFWNSTGAGDLVDTATFTSGRPNRIAWNKAVAGPTLRGLTQTHVGEEPRPWAWRKNGSFNMLLPMFGDSAGRPRTAWDFFEPVAGSVTLYRDATRLHTAPISDVADLAVPDEAATYRLTADARLAGDRWRLSTTVATEWRFRSSSADEGKALPLLTARFDPPVDLSNRAPGGRRFTFPAYMERQDGAARITAFTVDVSYDDGANWQRAIVHKERGSWKVSVRHPRAGYASLRASATDANGNTVVQTILRAYHIG